MTIYFADGSEQSTAGKAISKPVLGALTTPISSNGGGLQKFTCFIFNNFF